MNDNSHINPSGELEPVGTDIFSTIDSNTHIIYERKRKVADFVGDRYLKGEILGEGCTATVKEMLDTQTLNRCAVKIVTRKKIRKIPNGEKNVNKEISILWKLSHPNVIKLLNTFHDPAKDKIYLVLEFCLGDLQSLLDHAPNKHFGVWQSQHYFNQLMLAVEYIHSQGIIHKDIKPGNLLVTTDDTLKLTDFGVAEELSLYSPSDSCRLAQGAPAFQSPEEVTGMNDSWSGFKADIWSSGVILYNFTTGKYPFEGDCLYQIIHSIQEDEIKIPTFLDKDLRDLLSHMLDKNPEARISVNRIRTHPWCIIKINTPPDKEIVKFGPFATFDDPNRGPTVLPYLEDFHHYSTDFNNENQNDKHKSLLQQELYITPAYNPIDLQYDCDRNNLLITPNPLGGSAQEIGTKFEESGTIDLFEKLRLATSAEVLDSRVNPDNKKTAYSLVKVKKTAKGKKKQRSCNQQ